jgi:hypothetical protein
MTLQELIHMFGDNKKFYVSSTIFTSAETQAFLNFPHATISTAGTSDPKTYIIGDYDVTDSRFTRMM